MTASRTFRVWEVQLAQRHRSCRADEVIDDNAHDFIKVVADCDAVVDTVSGEVTNRPFALLRPGGRLASIATGGAAPRT